MTNVEISEEEEGEEEVEEVENVDERTDRRAEKILLGEEVSSSSEEEEQGKMDVEGKERNYHTDTDSDLVSRIVTFYASIPHFFNSTSFFLFCLALFLFDTFSSMSRSRVTVIKT